jgi:hypothetical protein
VDLESAVVMNESQLPETVHEKADARPGGSDHLCQSFLTDLGHNGLGSTRFAEMSEQ